MALASPSVPGPAIAALQLAGPPGPWEQAGFAVGPDGRAQVGATALAFGAGSDGGGIAGWTLTGAGPAELDGLPTGWIAPDAPRADSAGHPNTALALDHLVIATPDPERTWAALESAGMALRRERRAGTPERPLRQGFFRHGEAIAEVVGPATPDGDGPAAFWGLTFTVADLDAAAARLGDRLGAPRQAVQPGRRIATIRREAGLGTAVALMSAGPAGARQRAAAS
jgi:glyoxalase/bleomycin resistance protein/dioxygenase superfamily protein